MAVNPIEAGATSLKDELTDTAVFVLPYAAGLLAITMGWKWVRKFVH